MELLGVILDSLLIVLVIILIVLALKALDTLNKVDVILESNYYDNKYVSDMTRSGKLDYSDVDK